MIDQSYKYEKFMFYIGKGSKYMGIVISVINNKGGVAKTTSVLLLAELLAYLDQKVLVVDLDGQSNVSLALHAYVEEAESSIMGRTVPNQENIFEVFVDRLRGRKEIMSRVIYPTNIKGISILPSNKRFGRIESCLMDCYKGPFILSKALRAIKEDFNFILIDNAPALDFFTMNSIAASDYIITPVREDGFSKKGLKEILDVINDIKEEHDLDHVKFLGTFLTQVDPRTNIFKERIHDYERSIPDLLFKTYIRKDTKVTQMESKFIPMLSHSLESNALLDYCHLLLEMNILCEPEDYKLRKSIGEAK